MVSSAATAPGRLVPGQRVVRTVGAWEEVGAGEPERVAVAERLVLLSGGVAVSVGVAVPDVQGSVPLNKTRVELRSMINHSPTPLSRGSLLAPLYPVY
ncbi:hypothetical protein AB4305_20200 [Nocardia sp. 2YAB30]|uniref:hypothetical protein n=1 Tax=Nocardia sp. 2YAB30 TaxID=3233022 RepID=UPI003F95CFE7